MIEFWLGTFVVGAGVRMALEVLRDQDQWAVLLSKADDVDTPTSLTCQLAFTNAPDSCNVWHDRGFPLIDATISFDKSTESLTVGLPCFHAAPAMDYDTRLLTVTGIGIGVPPATGMAVNLLPTPYVQELQSPDGAQPGLLLNQQSATWQPTRQNILKITGSLPVIGLDLGNEPARLPPLAPLASQKIALAGAWVGTIGLPDKPVVGPVTSIKVVDSGFGIPAYRFEDVELVGFRIDLAAFGRDVADHLTALTEPLNFHLRDRDPDRPLPDFRYQVAAPMLLIELLRYGQMKSTNPSPPLTKADRQSQHELIVRLLVGRVADDTAQAFAPATYSPAIFVDNPWSKVLGRDMLGYDKRLADFCVQRGGAAARLLPDGRVAGPGAAGNGPVPLTDISRIHLACDGTGKPRLPLMDLDCRDDGSLPDSLTSLNLNAAFLSLLGAVRWQQSDFENAVFGSGFAQQAISESIRTFRCVQVAPVGDRGDLEPTWVSGKFTIDPDIRVGIPLGTADLTLHAIDLGMVTAAPSVPLMWNRLCQMLGDGKTAHLRIPPGAWYRLGCSMDLVVDDELS